MNKIRHAIFDILGLLLILTSPLLGWLPGPGGIPLLIAGLGFLAMHHDWARKMLHYTKKNGVKISDYIFRQHPLLEAGYDILSILLLAGGTYLLNTYTRNIIVSIAIVLLLTGITIIIGNRKRLRRFHAWVKHKLNA